jgi:hypothetical protein
VTWQVREHGDLWLHVRMRKTPNCDLWVDYEVRQLGTRDADGKHRFLVDTPEGREETDDPERKPPFLHGTIKWDGCSHNYFDGEGRPGDGYLHGCGRGDMTRLGDLFDRLFDQALEMLGPEWAEYLASDEEPAGRA